MAIITTFRAAMAESFPELPEESAEDLQATIDSIRGDVERALDLLENPVFSNDAERAMDLLRAICGEM